MDAKERRDKLQKLLEKGKPLTGTVLAKQMGVSRQVIVTDIALLRAAGTNIFATPQGYIVPLNQEKKLIKTKIPCRHSHEKLEQELRIIIDNGGKVLDVIVEHPIYGEIKANLMLSSRREINEFLAKLADSKAKPLSVVTDGIHLHTVEVESEEALEIILAELREAGILVK